MASPRGSAGHVARRLRAIIIRGPGQWDWGFLLAVALALLAAMPFLSRPGLPRGTDAELHVYRAAELGRSLDRDALYPRWAPNLYLGYGYPIFNYYAPFTYYLANLFSLLPGVGIVAGVKAVFVTGLVLASVGTYAFGRTLFGIGPGLLAAACFVFAPYVVFIDPHARGDLAEHFAISLLPVVFFAFDQLVSRKATPGTFAGSVLSLAVLVYSHNLMALVGAGLLGAYWIWGILFCSERRHRAGWGALAFITSAALVAFFWLPAMLEWDAVNLIVTGPGHFDFRNHYVALAELLAPSRVIDLGATSPRFRFNLGVAQWVLAVPGSIWFLLARRQRVRAYFAVAAIGLCLLMVASSTVIWEAVPWLAYLQFPWRLLGPANLALAVCVAGTAFLVGGARRSRCVLWAGGLGVILATSLPVMYPPMWSPDFGGTGPLDVIHWEMNTLAYGTTSTGDFVPKGAALVPMRPTESLLASYTAPGPVDKVNRATVPEDTTVTLVARGPARELFWISTGEKYILRLYTFYFPGWQAWVDSQRVEIEIAGPEGFITVPVPPGEHFVEVRFGDTPARTAGWAVSGVGCLVLVGIVGALHSMGRSAGGSRSPDELDAKDETPVGAADILCLAAVIAMFVGLKSWVIDPHDDLLRYTSPPGQAWAAQQETSGNFGGQIELIGYDIPASPVRSGESFPVVLYWRALQPPDDNYQSFVHLARPDHVLWGQEDHLNPGGYPTTRWPLDRYVWDEYEVQVLPGTPPGEYTLDTGLYLLFGNYRLPVLAQEGGVAGDSFRLGSVRVTRPRRPPRPHDLDMASGLDARFWSEGVTLLGYSQATERVTSPDDVLAVTLFWRADDDRPPAAGRALELVDANGRRVWRAVGEPGGYPFAGWWAGDVIRDPIVIDLRQLVGLDDGRYRITVSVIPDPSRTSSGNSTIDSVVALGEVWFEWGTATGAGASEGS
jgi:hypothetical protein